MSRYDGLIIPRSYSEYLNKTDSATLSQMLQHLTGLWSHAVSAGDQKPVTSNAVYAALTDAATIQQALQLPGVLSGAVAAGDNKAVKSSAVNNAIANLRFYHKDTITYGLKIKILDKVSEKGSFFNAIFSWSSYGEGNYMSMYLLRLSYNEVTSRIRICGTTSTDTADFKMENGDLYFYPNGYTEIPGGGGAYVLLLS